MSDHDTEEEGFTPRPSYPFSAWGLAYEVVLFVSSIFGTVATFFMRLAADFGSYHNHSIDKRKEDEGRRLLMDDLKSFERGERP